MRNINIDGEHGGIPMGVVSNVFCTLAILVCLCACNNAAQKEDLGSELQGLSENERSFLFEARELSRLYQAGHLSKDDIKSIYKTHSEWLNAREQESKRPQFYSKIGTDAESARDLYVPTRVLERPDDLRGKDLRWSYLTGAVFRAAVISGTGDRATIGFSGKPEFGIDLTNTNLIGANLSRADGKETLLRVALLIGTDFSGADLSGAKLYNSDLRWANLAANLKGADFGRSNVANATWDVVSGGLPDIPEFASAIGIEQLTYRKSPSSLVELRTALRIAGYEQQGRAVTHAIKRTELRMAMQGSLLDKSTALLSWIAFELTSGYGLYPFRPLIILIALIVPFAFLYTRALLRPGHSGIYVNRPKDSLNRKQLGSWVGVKHRGKGISAMLRTARVALWFAVLNAFRVGYREFNVGDWLIRLQSREYVLAGRGWVRTAAGIQSLLSLYLLALSVICFFGRPFG